MLHSGNRLVEKQLTNDKSQLLFKHFDSLGIRTELNVQVNSIESLGTKKLITYSVENTYQVQQETDGVIVATGFAPRIELAKAAALKVQRGIVVDRHFKTSKPNIYAIGDLAEVDKRIYPFISPIRSQAVHLAKILTEQSLEPWYPPFFVPTPKIHGIKLL